MADLQRVFAEDWDFAAGQQIAPLTIGLPTSSTFSRTPVDGPYPLQILDSGPDRDVKGIREIYFTAILKARKRVWIASPYFVPDSGLLDALRLAGRLGLDVRFLGQNHPDKWLPQFAARYYWSQVLPAGIKVYQYTKGMMHSKVVMVDGIWASVGTANLDNRSLHLNFEVNCLIYAQSCRGGFGSRLRARPRGRHLARPPRLQPAAVRWPTPGKRLSPILPRAVIPLPLRVLRVLRALCG